MDAELNPLAGNRNLTPAEIAKAAALALEKRCPRVSEDEFFHFTLGVWGCIDWQLVSVQEQISKQASNTFHHIARVKHFTRKLCHG